MDCFTINGGRALRGTVVASGSKNAALPILAASLLAAGPVRLRRVPKLVDVDVLRQLLSTLGARVQHTAGELLIDTPQSGPVVAPPALVRQMRASFCVLGPLLARRGQARAPLPGGCQIGARPIDLHLRGLAALGADIQIESGWVVAQARRLRGACIDLAGPHGPTVTGTANVLCAATLARGVTVIRGAAREPEIVDLGRFLTALGANIAGLGTEVLEIRGVDELGSATHEIIPDRIETATLLLAGAITGGEVRVTRVEPTHLTAVIALLEQLGCQLAQGPDWLSLCAAGRGQGAEILAQPYPGIPTDVQAQFTALLTLAQGRSVVRDCVFPQRFQHLAELRRLSARVTQQAGAAVVDGVPNLQGARVTACDLRASAALVLAALAADGQSVVQQIEHLDRGYEGLELKLRSLGATIERSSVPAGGAPARLAKARSVTIGQA